MASMNPEATPPVITPEQWAALDRLAEVTTAPAATVAEGRTGKAATLFLDPLVQAGWLLKQGTKYTLTQLGRTTWQQYAPPERLLAVQTRHAKEARERLLAFLHFIEQKGGKLSAADAKKWAATKEQALGEYLVPGPKANTFTLTAAGERLVLSAKPVAEQLKHIHRLSGELAERWQTLHARWQQELLATLRPTSTLIEQQTQAALATLARSTAAATAFDEVARAAHAVQQELDASRAELRRAEERLQEHIARQQADLQQLDHDYRERLKPLQAALPTATADVWGLTRTAYHELMSRASQLGGIVTIPELAERVLAQATHLDRAAFAQQLLAWERDDRLTLQLCNDRHLEPRASEGIESPRGLLFYVRLK